MSEQAIVDRNEKGQFIKGGANPWRMPAWRPGQTGRPAKYKSPKTVANICQQYIEQQVAEDKALTWSGLARYMGMARPSLDAYAKGEIEQASPGVSTVLQYMKTVIEEQREERLTDKGYATQGLIFALKNHHGWRDEKHLTVDQTETQQVQLVLSPELAQKMRDTAEDSLAVIEGECEVLK